MIQNSHNTSSTHSSNNGTSSAPQSTSGASSGNLAIPNWAIAVIVVAGVAIIAAALGSFWFLRRVRRHRQQRKLAADELVVRDTKHEPSSALSSPTSHPSSTHLVGTLKTAQSSSINSFTPILGGASGSLRGASPTTETSPPHQLKSVTSAATAKKDGVLSSNDAMMLADTFRKHLRKPEWTDDSESALLEEKK
ncbi:hypothetical protein BC940DRAFT_313011 [Gongronella butleri]|nr:hypothetical protein BC940DRAFT_313011 [Gongronella butleri]